MGKYNYTKRVELFWDIDEVERDVFIAVNSLIINFYYFKLRNNT